LLAAWFLAATMNAMLTWWGVSLALLNHDGLGNEILSRATLLSVVPVFVAVLVWLIRILLIGLLSMAGDRLFTFVEQGLAAAEAEPQPLPIEAPQPRGASVAGVLAAVQSRLPAAEWAGGSRPTPAPAGPRTARVIGNATDEGASAAGTNRPATVAERHGYGRFAQPNPGRTATPPPPAATVRPQRPDFNPAPKPATRPNEVRPVPARVPSGHGNGNGNGHSRNPSPPPPSDLDFDD
jgi:hypothetical protein